MIIYIRMNLLHGKPGNFLGSWLLASKYWVMLSILLTGKKMIYTFHLELLSICYLINRDYGVLLLGDNPETAVDVALKLVEEGLAKVRDNCQDKALLDAQEAARNAKKGLHGEGFADHIRKITWEVDDARRLVDKNGGKPVSAVVEHVRDGTTTTSCYLIWSMSL